MMTKERDPVRGATQATRPSGALATIEERISSVARSMREIGHKLNEHADTVHGPVPTTPNNVRTGDEQDCPSALLERIFVALDYLDQAASYMAEAAGRNCTLA